MRDICLNILVFTSTLSSFAQDIEVKKFEPLEKDQTAVTSPRKDINGNTCGVVKVALKEAGAEFEGNVMGDVQFTGSEYLVYLTNGTKRLGIKHPDYLPTTIIFADYGNPRIESNKVYGLLLECNNVKNKTVSDKKKVVLFDVIPHDTQLYIDDQLIANSGDGAYAVTLNHGIHYYSIKSDNFCIYNQVVKVNGKTSPIKIDITEFYSSLEVTVPTKDTDIFVNNKLCGRDKWKGFVPPGQYLVEARKKGSITQAKTFELVENDSVCVIFNEMASITGSLTVNYKPDGSEVIIDGKSSGVTPLYISEIPVGEHRVSIKKEGFDFVLKFITIEDGQNLTLEGSLDYSSELRENILGK